MNDFLKPKLEKLKSEGVAGAGLADEYVSVFELNIRVLGGLLGAYSLVKDVNTKEEKQAAQVLLEWAVWIGDTVRDKAFPREADRLDVSGGSQANDGNVGTQRGFVQPEINLKTRRARKHPWTNEYTLSELGSLQLEWRYLSYLTKDPSYQR